MPAFDAAAATLEFKKHSTRLSRLQSAVTATLTAIDDRTADVEKRWLESQVQELFAEALKKVQESCDPKPTADEVAQGLKSLIIPTESAKRIVLSFGPNLRFTSGIL
jgi:hypothetical protein